MADYDDFAAFARRLTAVADVPDYTFHWWKLRPHPKLGTVEIRALDVQAAPAHTAALVAAVHALARHEALADPVPGPPPEILEEACFRAARNGVDAAAPGRRGPAAAGAGAAGADAGARAAERARAGLRGRARRALRRWSRPAAAPASSAARRATRPTRGAVLARLIECSLG